MGTSLGSGLRGFKESLSGEEPSHVDISHTESSPAAVADTPALTPAPQPVVAAVSSEASEARTPQTVGAAR